MNNEVYYGKCPHSLKKDNNLNKSEVKKQTPSK